MTDSSQGNDAEVREELAVFGLSETEIETYLAVLSGNGTTREIAERADVTQRAVYDLAERLAERGLVRVDEHASPTTVRAVPPGEAIERLSERLESVRPTLEDVYTETSVDQPEIQVVRSRATAIDRLREGIEAAEREIAVAIPADAYPEIESTLAAAHDRGVFVLLLVGDTDDDAIAEREFAAVADVVRHWEAHPQFMYVVDDADAMIGDSAIVDRGHTDEHAVYVAERNLAGSIFSAFLGAYWPASTELFVADPSPLPRTFTWFREAAFQAAVHDRAGTDLHAAVETVDGDHLAGPVTAINQQFVDPPSGAFPLQNSLVVATDEGDVSLGGRGSFLEDHEVASITLTPER